MNDFPDRQLLLDYASRRDEAAFAEIVNRYRDLVYSAARRQVNAADAAEVAQSVFIDLAAKAGSVAERLPPGGSLAGWLHRGTRFAALNQLRAAHRRATNETQAMQHLASLNDPGPDWTHIQPVLDEAIDRLADDDRAALLLRFFQNQDFRAVGRALGVSDDTAQKRVSRALERLRVFLVQSGVTVSVTALAVALSNHAVQAAPAGFVVSLASAAKAATAATATVTTTAKSIIAMTTFQKGLVVASVAVAAVVGVRVYQRSETSVPAAPPVNAAQASKAPNSDQVRELNAQIESLTSALEQAKKSNERTITERDGALRAAAIYKELAERKEKSAEGAVSVPSHRHFMQGLGQIAAYFAASHRLDKSLLSEDEQLALKEDEVKMGLSMVKLYRAARAGGMVSDDPAAASNQNQPDNTACFINGALNLNQEQFKQVYSLISQYNVPGLPIVPESEDITAERMVVVKQRRAELDRQIAATLNPDQLARFQALQNDFHIINPYDGSVRFGYSGPKN